MWLPDCAGASTAFSIKDAKKVHHGVNNIRIWVEKVIDYFIILGNYLYSRI